MRRDRIKKRKITNDEMKDPIIIRSFLKAYNERTIDAGYLSRNKKIKTNCITTKPKRGNKRLFIDRYLDLSIPNPYERNSYLRCNAHRVAAFLFLGELEEELFSLHKCDIKMCCNPDHLYIGTWEENATDFLNRRGDQGPNKMLTRHEWESINYWKERGEHTLAELSEHFGLTPCNIDRGGQNFTTDGSEVIGEVFVPRIIPEASRITRMKQKIELGNEFIELSKFCKQYGWKFLWELDEECEEKSISRGYAYRVMRLAKAKPHRENLKYGFETLLKNIRNGVDVSVPFVSTPYMAKK
jgi:hypothetical protein